MVSTITPVTVTPAARPPSSPASAADEVAEPFADALARASETERDHSDAATSRVDRRSAQPEAGSIGHEDDETVDRAAEAAAALVTVAAPWVLRDSVPSLTAAALMGGAAAITDVDASTTPALVDAALAGGEMGVDASVQPSSAAVVPVGVAGTDAAGGPAPGATVSQPHTAPAQPTDGVSSPAVPTTVSEPTTAVATDDGTTATEDGATAAPKTVETDGGSDMPDGSGDESRASSRGPSSSAAEIERTRQRLSAFAEVARDGTTPDVRAAVPGTGTLTLDAAGSQPPATDLVGGPSAVAAPRSAAGTLASERVAVVVVPSASAWFQAADELAAGASRVRIVVRVDPPELGPINVQFVARGREVHVSMTAADPNVPIDLRNQEQVVRQALESRGFDLSGFDVGAERRGDDGRRPASTPTSSAFEVDLDLELEPAMSADDGVLRL